MTTPSGTATGSYNDTAGGTTGETSAFTPSGSNRAVLVLVVSSDGSPANASAVKYGGSGGTALTQIGNYETYGTYFRASIWGSTNFEPAASSNTVHVTWAATQGERLIIARAYQDVDQTTRFGTSVDSNGSSNTALVSSIGASATDLIADFCAIGDVAAVGCGSVPLSSQSEIVRVATSPAYDVAELMELLAGGTSVNRSQGIRDEPTGGAAISKPWAMFGVAVKEFTGAPPVTGGFRSRIAGGLVLTGR